MTSFAGGVGNGQESEGSHRRFSAPAGFPRHSVLVNGVIVSPVRIAYAGRMCRVIAFAAPLEASNATGISGSGATVCAVTVVDLVCAQVRVFRRCAVVDLVCAQVRVFRRCAT